MASQTMGSTDVRYSVGVFSRVGDCCLGAGGGEPARFEKAESRNENPRLIGGVEASAMSRGVPSDRLELVAGNELRHQDEELQE